MADDAEPSRPLLRHPDFLKLWAAQTVSLVGTQITLLAVPILAALTLDVSPFEFGLLTTIEFLPVVLLSLPAGVWVDRLRRRPILVWADVGRAISLLSIPMAFAADALTLWQLYVVVFVNGCLTVFFDVAYQSYLPSLIERGQLVEGNARLELTRTVAQRVGPGAAGVLIGIVTAPFAILIDSLSYAVSALLLAWIRRAESRVPPRAAASGPRPSMRGEIAVGLRYVANQPWLRAIAVTVGIGNLFGMIADSILILHLVTERQFTPAAIGFAFTLGSVGVIAAALVTPRLTRVLGVGPTLVVVAAVEGLSWLPVALAPDALLFAALTATILVLGFCGVAWNINAVSLRQAITPRPMQGRMNATMRFISWGVIPLGSVLGGFLGGVIGLHATIWVGALGSVATFVPVALSSVRHIREMPAPADGGGGQEADPGAEADS